MGFDESGSKPQEPLLGNEVDNKSRYLRVLVHGPLDVRVSMLVILCDGWICVIWLILPGCGIFMKEEWGQRAAIVPAVSFIIGAAST